MQYKAQICLSLAALSALVLGLCIYLFERPADSVYLFTVFSFSPAHHFSLFGAIGQWLPSLVHTYAFILLTALAVGINTRVVLASAMFWLLIGWLFELGQNTSISIDLVEHLPVWFSSIPILENVGAYFQHGTYDPMDLLATLAGAVAAYATWQLMQKTGKDHETGKQAY